MKSNSGDAANAEVRWGQEQESVCPKVLKCNDTNQSGFVSACVSLDSRLLRLQDLVFQSLVAAAAGSRFEQFSSRRPEKSAWHGLRG